MNPEEPGPSPHEADNARRDRLLAQLERLLGPRFLTARPLTGSFDTTGRLVALENAVGEVALFYDGVGRLGGVQAQSRRTLSPTVQETPSSGAFVGGRTTYTYDPWGHVSRVVTEAPSALTSGPLAEALQRACEPGLPLQPDEKK